MKTYRNLYPMVYDFENLYHAYRKARRGERGNTYSSLPVPVVIRRPSGRGMVIHRRIEPRINERAQGCIRLFVEYSLTALSP